MHPAATLFLVCMLTAGTAWADPAPQAAVAMRGTPKYAATFTHFDYTNPDAPKGGNVRFGATGTFDSVQPFILKGIPAEGTTLPFDTLTESSKDEPFTQYGLLAKTITVAPDRSWVAYELRPEARFHDGHPVTAGDVVFSFEILKTKGRPYYRSYYKDVVKVETPDARHVKFIFKDGKNIELPLIIGQLPVLPKHFWQGKDFDATTLQPLLGSGPYKVATVDPGHAITFERVKDWWAKDLPIAKGRYNFDTIRFDYYRDEMVELEAFLAGRYDVRVENTAKLWATGYNAPPVKSGAIIKREIPNALPTGMQGFIFNLRRPVFQDVRVREALGLAFDFEWSNKNVAYGAYTRTISYFDNSDMAAKGLPDAAELKLLEPLRGKIPDTVFTQEYKPPVTDGSGNNRDNLRRAAALLQEAGWSLKNGKLIDSKGTQFTFEFLDNSTRFERWLQPFFRNLERLGIKTNFKVADTSQYQNRLDNFDFDMVTTTFPQSLSPGNEQREYWTSAKAAETGSRNLIGIKNPAIDGLVEAIVAAPDLSALNTACRALDRVLLWNHYVIPHWHIGKYRVAAWNKFGQPATPPKYDLGLLDTWWLDAAKSAIVKPQGAP
ncbi:MAG: extracellular solute-binding protein [Alphaproteobacteria bacterium]